MFVLPSSLPARLFVVLSWTAMILGGCAHLKTSSPDRSGEEKEVSSLALAHYSQGLIDETEGRFADANRQYQLAIELDPDREELYVRRAFNYLHLEDPQAAHDALNLLIARKPESPHPLIWKAKLLRGMRQMALAEAAYREALLIDPSLTGAHVELIDLMMSQPGREADVETYLRDNIQEAEDLNALRRSVGVLFLRYSAAKTPPSTQVEWVNQAADLFSLVLQDEPDDPELLAQTADLYLLLQDIDRAIPLLSHLIELRPEDTAAKRRLALALLANDRQEEALTVLESMTPEERGMNPALVDLGRMYQELRQPKKAMESYQRAIADSTLPLPQAYIPLILLQIEQDVPEVEEYLIQAAEALPDNPQITEIAAYWFMNNNQPEKASDFFDKARNIMLQEGIPLTPKLYFFSILTAQRSGDTDTAWERLRSGLLTYPGILDAYAQSVFQEKDTKLRIQMVNQFKRLLDDPDYQTYAVYRYLALFYNQAQDFDIALKYFEEAYRLGFFQQSDSQPPNKNQQELLDPNIPPNTPQQDLDDSDAQRAEKAQRSNFLFWYAAACERTQQYERAEKLFEECLEVDPNHAEACNYLAYMWAEQGVRLEEAKRLVAKAMEIVPDNPAFLDTLGWIYYKQGDYSIASSYINQANDLVPNDPTISDHLGDIAMAQNRPEEAIRHWTIALQQDITNEKIRTKIIEAGGSSPVIPPGEDESSEASTIDPEENQISSPEDVESTTSGLTVETIAAPTEPPTSPVDPPAEEDAR